MFKYFLDGCTTANGRFYQGGQTWALPNCKIGICAKSFNGGWEVSVEGWAKNTLKYYIKSLKYLFLNIF